MYNLEYDRVNDLFAECAYPIGEKPKGPDIIVDSISGVQFILSLIHISEPTRRS